MVLVWTQLNYTLRIKYRVEKEGAPNWTLLRQFSGIVGCHVKGNVAASPNLKQGSYQSISPQRFDTDRILSASGH